jgi:hypothetical protein
MAKFQVWSKDSIGKRTGLFAREHYTLDVAMDSAKELSQGSTKKQVWNNDAKNPWGIGTMVDVEIPNAYAVIEKGDKQSRVRGWGIGGAWKDAVDCKSCKNSGDDSKNYNEPCFVCKGASYRPKV